MGDSPPLRLCPECGHRGSERVCPVDGLPTVDEARFAARGGAQRLVGKVFDGRYRVDGVLGRGASGWVLRARQLRTGRDVALKVLRTDLGGDLRQVKRFYREAKATSRLRSPHAVCFHDFGATDEGYLYIAMELLTGFALDDALAEGGAFAASDAVSVARQVCLALEDAHGLGLIHRDLKPGNIFLCPPTRASRGLMHVKVLDFGLTKAMRDDEESALTQTGFIVGTPRYMAPEQTCGGRISERTDLYSLGIVLYHMLTGEPPFVAESAEEVLLMQAREEAPALPEMVDGRPIPDSLRRLVAALLRKVPLERPATAREVRDALDRIARGETGPCEVGEEDSQVGWEYELPAIPSNEPVTAWSDPEGSQLATGRRGMSSALVSPDDPDGRPGPRARRHWLGPAVGGLIAAGVALALVGTGPEPAPAGDAMQPPAAFIAQDAPVAASAPGGPAGEELPRVVAGEALIEVVEPAPEASPLPEAPPEPEPQPEVPATTLVHVESAPPGAKVFEGDELLGRTPVALRVTEAGRMVRLERRGHVPTSFLVGLDTPNRVTVSLEPKSRPRSSKSPPRERVAPAPAPEPEPPAEPPNPPQQLEIKLL